MKTNPLLQSMLTHLAHDAARPDEIDLWPALQARLAAERKTSQAKETNMNTGIFKTRSYRAAMAGALTLLLAMAMIFVLPQGRAWAASVLRFFIPNSDVVALTPAQPVELVEAGQAEPQPAQTNPQAWQPEFADTCGGWTAPRCTLEQIRALVSFPVKALVAPPAGAQFSGATGGPQGVALVYPLDDGSGALLLMQGAADAGAQAVPVGASAVVEIVSIHTIIGEYINGGYFHWGGEVESRWDANAGIQSLRWEEDGILYTITATGMPGDRDRLVGLAAALTLDPTYAAEQADPGAYNSIAEVEQAAGFAVLEPVWLPDGFQFHQALYLADRQTVCLVYTHPSDQPVAPNQPPAPSLTIAQRAAGPLPAAQELLADGIAPDLALLLTSELRVGGAADERGAYAYGSLAAGSICATESFQDQALWVQVDGIHAAILAQKSGALAGTRNWLTRLELVRLAEGMTGVSTIAKNQPDPEFLTSLDDIRALAGFGLRFPTRLPDGMALAYGQVLEEGGEVTVALRYSDGSTAFTFSQARGGGETFETIRLAQPGIFREVSVGGQPALLSQGYFSHDAWIELPEGGDGALTLVWFADGIRYSITGFNAYASAAWIEIAESVR